MSTLRPEDVRARNDQSRAVRRARVDSILEKTKNRLNDQAASDAPVSDPPSPPAA